MSVLKYVQRIDKPILVSTPDSSGEPDQSSYKDFLDTLFYFLKTVMLRKTILILFFATNFLVAQNIGDVRVHSHNDYLQKTPFWQAFASGATSIEADVILKEGQLYVAHEESSITPKHTLENLYLKPLRQVDHLYGTQRLDIQLLVDLKTNSHTTLAKLIKELEPYKDLFKPYRDAGITLVVSGNRPKPEEYGTYPEHIYFDCQEIEDTRGASWDKVAMISTSFKNFSQWNGLGRMVQPDLEKIKAYIHKAQQKGKPVRFWATPDTKTAWRTFYELGVGYINTDEPQNAVPYLKNLPQQTYSAKGTEDAYSPTFSHDIKAKKVKNIIFLIGDGMGLSQISAGDFISGDSGFHMSKLKSIGFVRTQSADNFGTDSAAGGTAYATGVRTNNRAIGTNILGNAIGNIVEALSKLNYTTGIVTTDHLTGATPAAFYAHVKDRDETRTITYDLVDSPLDFFAGGGREDYSEVLPALKKKFVLLDDVAGLKKLSKDAKAGLFLSDGNLISIKEGRGALMPQLIRELLPLLKAKENPFFVMIEGAQIDTYGHFNDTDGIVREVLDFDAMVGEALRFADWDGETLVVITADHETGGFSLLDGNRAQRTVEGDFTTHDHTGTMVPLFAYGPGSYLFQGVYDNTQVYDKILQLLGLQDH